MGAGPRKSSANASVEERTILKVSDASEQSSPSKIELSVLIRALNEADRIASTIKSALPLGAEIVVVDAGSKDDTVSIARSLGAVVYHNPWPGFGPQRHWGEDRCSHNFILSLDADEILTPELVAEIRALFAVPNTPRLMNLRKVSIYPHHKQPPPLAFYHEQILIYDRRIARTLLNPNWDKLEIDIDERPYTLKNPVLHHSLRDWHHAVAKINYTAKLAADTGQPRSRFLLVVRLLVEFPAAFIKAYFFRRYFLSGADGFIQAMIVAFGRFMRIAMKLERTDYGPKE